MADISVSVSLKKKIELCNGLQLIAQSADFFKEDKKLLKSLARALRKQRKSCAKSVYPMTETDKSEVFLFVSDLGEIVKNLAKVKRVLDFQVWNGRLVNFVVNLKEKLNAMALDLEKAEKAVDVKKKRIDEN